MLDYKDFRENSGAKILGTWDDHDFGINDGGKSNPIKEEMRQIFLDSIDEPKDSTRRTRKDGIYTSYYIDEKRHIKLILLDNRFNNDESDLYDTYEISFPEYSTYAILMLTNFED